MARVGDEPYALMTKALRELNELAELKVDDNGEELDKARALLDKV